MAWRRRVGLAYSRMPGSWLRSPGSEAVLSIALGRLDPSVRFKQVAHPAQRIWMHHLEVRAPEELDGQVAAWLREAYDRAG